ncbi:hypothetical protein CcaverHIS002_0100230 [Cutaneotrichosporon cavernicola]|uniref:VWFA domain-containing protein n=1 Tax=Cutaneotrichosporon cavernicola TaxID=279322 RepID=A0AA48IHP0_9TREE|nr:uncharacterized protein CcaverHIS019_0100210 [Cutaneotrichosporon cavernicola]BEI79494.1 hypothetical protein CcaverHIS002_0100230 [Cutaneotrichosporon cavernicola]BEI87303.1 hypothetical protein CcaverHIS019_0100210 [Cutaneotrichosporon cavernicola]BEI95073.1 hypothetical protein CcaverHIS631_0100220 [Cutaneotrichosporon cavernicola]BEJ02847.1 hypothetical protein CcaverHIS641_0100220 [Cutaneotrichosporon cavernicola]
MARGVLPFPDLPIINAADVANSRSVELLLCRDADNKPAHDFAVVKLYIECKLWRRKSIPYVIAKLEELEKWARPVNGNVYELVRDYFGFPPSTLSRPPAWRKNATTSATPPPAYPSQRAQVPPPPLPPLPPVRPSEYSTARTSISSHGSSSNSHVSHCLSPTFAGFGKPGVPPNHHVHVDRPGASSSAPDMDEDEDEEDEYEDEEDLVLEMLRDYDTVFVIDDSSSMRKDGRWDEARSAVRFVVHEACKYDDDGIDIYFLNAKRDQFGVKDPDYVDSLFNGLRPRGATPTGTVLEKILLAYMSRLEAATAAHRQAEVKQLNIIVITDGKPTDHPESVIVSCARRLDRGNYPARQVGIQFFQVGNDPDATAALKKLDDNLGSKYGIRDIVDTVQYIGALTSADKVLLGGVNPLQDELEIESNGQ